MPEQTDIYISSFPDAESITNADKVTGLQGNANKNFTFSSILAWFVNAVKSAFVPVSRTINGKTLDTNIALTASDVGLGNVANERQYSASNPPPLPTPSGIGAQPTITASGILKGDGAGGVSAATPGTDYQAPLTAGTDYATPGMIPTVPSAYTSNPAMDGTASPGSSGAWAKGDHVHPSDTTKANQAQIAYVETGATASKNHAVGELFCWNGSLLQATSAIPAGTPFNSGSGGNCKSAYATAYSSGAWTPTNASAVSNAPDRNGFIRYGNILVVYVAITLNSDLANLSQVDICTDVASEMGVDSVLTVFANAPAFSTFTSAIQPDILLRLQYNNNKLTLINRSGSAASKTNRVVYANIVLYVL